MSKKWSLLLGLLLYLLPFHVNAKTVYYVKSGATGDGSSWLNASGNIQAMINKASLGDEVWIAEGTYYPEKEYEWSSMKDRTFKLRPGVSLYGGFAGTERSIQERKRIDRDKNGSVESWEFQYETILSGEGNVKDIIIKDDDDQIDKILNIDDNCENVVIIEYDGYDKNTIPPCVSGFTVVGGASSGIDVYNSSDLTATLIVECDIYYNGKGLWFCRNVANCNVHHNTETGIYQSIAYNCHIFKNKESGASNSSLYDCIIENNYTDYDGGGTTSSNLYNCIVRDNFAKRNGGGTSNGSLENCKVYNNKTLGNGGGTYGGTLKNCEVYNNEALGNGGGISDGTARNCSIFNNKAGEEGGGCYRGNSNNGSSYNCNIYNNYAPAYGGISSSSYNCTIVNNKSFSGNENKGGLTNCIVVGTFEGNASYSAFTDSYVKGDGNFLATEKELKFVKSTSFTGNASNEKQFEELKNVDFRLSKGSSAIDMGQQKFGISLPPEDYSGYPRPMGVKTDIGAHEYPSYRALPYENKFDESSLSMNVPEAWTVEKLPGKSEHYLYYTGDYYYSQREYNYITTPFFDKTASNKINLSFDIAAKFKTTDQKEKMHIILAYLESDKRDTIMSYSNTDYIQDVRFSKEISSWVKNKVFRILFAVEDSHPESSNNSNIVYCGISNLKISKQDATVDIIAKDKVCMYDGKPQSVDFQINDTRVDKNKVVVTYQKEGSTQSSTTPPTNAGVYKVLISIEDGSYFEMKEVKLTIEKANQKILWEQKLTTMGTLEKIRLEAKASSGLPVQYSVDDELLAKIEKIDKDWWLVSDTLIGNVTVKASQSGNENYNLANSVLKTIKVYSNLTDIAEIETNNVKAYYLKEGNSIRIEGAPIGCKVYVYDVLGHLYTSKEMIYGEDQIQMRNTSGGIYYLLFVDKDKKRTIKILTD